MSAGGTTSGLGIVAEQIARRVAVGGVVAWLVAMVAMLPVPPVVDETGRAMGAVGKVRPVLGTIAILVSVAFPPLLVTALLAAVVRRDRQTTSEVREASVGVGVVTGLLDLGARFVESVVRAFRPFLSSLKPATGMNLPNALRFRMEPALLPRPPDVSRRLESLVDAPNAPTPSLRVFP